MTGHRHAEGAGTPVLVPDETGGGPPSVAALLDPLLHRLRSMDVINRGMMFAAVLLLCFVPFCIVLQAAAGGSATARLTKRWGLSAEAASAVGKVFGSPNAASAAMTAASWLVLIAFAIGAAATLQELYVAAFGLTGAGGRGNAVRLLVWITTLLAMGALGAVAQPWLDDVGGAVLVLLASFVAGTAFWWFTMWLLLAGRLSWSELLPSALATGLFWVGMVLVFRLTMSSTIVSNYDKYGPIGVVFALMYLMVAIGVVVILGAITGVVWRERGAGETP